jgi:hypothetical protein
MNHKEITAHIRKRIAAAGIKAKCKMQEHCGYLVVAVDVPTFDAEFTVEQQQAIKLAAKVNKLTFAQGMAIDLEHATNPKEFKFYFSARSHA